MIEKVNFGNDPTEVSLAAVTNTNCANCGCSCPCAASMDYSAGTAHATIGGFITGWWNLEKEIASQ